MASGWWSWPRWPTPRWCRAPWPRPWACARSRAAPLLAGLSAYLKDKQLLLVLDNCEHLIEACAALASRPAAGLPAPAAAGHQPGGPGLGEETLYRVPSLAFPDPDAAAARSRGCRGYAAVALLLERAQARGAASRLSAHNAAAVAAVCARLDGIPLAIELAAARLSALPVEQVAARLDDCFRLLTGGSRTAVPRQRTLRATMDWSYELLSRQEQAVLRRLAVFAGGWTLEAAEAICADAEAGSAGTPLRREPSAGAGRDDAAARLPAGAVLDALAGLVDKSLVLLEASRLGDDATPADGPRYRLLETMRQYAQEHLEVAGETVAVRDRHLGWCLALAEEGEVGIKGPAQVAWLRRLEREHDNLRAALAWSVQGATRPLEPQGQPYGVEPEAGLRMVAALWWFWVEHGHLSEGLRWVDDALAAAGSGATVARTHALIGKGYFTLVRGGDASIGRAHALFGESRSVAETLGDRGGTAQALFYLAMTAMQRMDHDEARRLYVASLALFRQQHDGWSIARTLCKLATTGPVFVQGHIDYERDIGLLKEGLLVARGIGQPAIIAETLYELGCAGLYQDDLQGAEPLLAESLISARIAGDKRVLAESLAISGLGAAQAGDFAGARSRFEECLGMGRAIGHTRLQEVALLRLGTLAIVRGDSSAATAAATESLALAQQLLPDAMRENIAENVHVLAGAAAATGRLTRSAQLLGAHTALTGASGQRPVGGLPASHLCGRLQGTVHAVGVAVRASLGDDVFASAWGQGAIMTLEEAIVFALADGVMRGFATDPVPMCG